MEESQGSCHPQTWQRSIVSKELSSYKLYERVPLKRLSLLIDAKLTKDQACFQHGRSCKGLFLNLTQHIEDGFECRLIIRAAFVDLLAAYDTVQHCVMIKKLLNMIVDLDLCQVIRSLLTNRRLCDHLNDHLNDHINDHLNGQKSRGELKKRPTTG